MQRIHDEPGAQAGESRAVSGNDTIKVALARPGVARRRDCAYPARFVAGRRLEVHLEPYAATAGDVWLYDSRTRLAIAGDLVVGLVPFMDTACPEGWRAALGHIAAAPFTVLIPGHGAPMDRAAFARWRTAFDNLLDCAAGDADKQACADGWVRDAAPFIADADKGRAAAYALYYIESRLRAAPAEKARYCRGGGG